MKPVIDYKSAAALIKSGSTLMIGGFLNCGVPHRLIEALLRTDVENLTVISNDHGRDGLGISKLVSAGRIAKAQVSHIGLNQETVRQMDAGLIEVEIMPQGTFAERLRCGGSGLGGVLTPTGVGTVVEKGKTKLTVDGREYLLEKPIRAQAAILRASQADRFGNLYYKRTSRNFQPLMAMAADLVIAEVEELVEVLDPDMVHTPGILVDYLVKEY